MQKYITFSEAKHYISSETAKLSSTDIKAKCQETL